MTPSEHLPVFKIRSGHPDFRDLPWDYPLAEWQGRCVRLEDLPRGVSRHTVIFVNYSGYLYALKELPSGVAQTEFKALRHLEELRLPAVKPVGTVQLRTPERKASTLITTYLDHALPYRMLFMQTSLNRYRDHLLDAMAGLLVQLHLAGIFWGDCSLSNTLFRRDAGTLQAYLVDAETTEIFPPRLEPTMRFHDLEIMEENLMVDLKSLASSGLLASGFLVTETGSSIRQRYRGLWEEIDREEIINPGETYRVQERIRALNMLGFSLDDVEMRSAESGNQLRLRFFVTDRHFHSEQLLSFTGLEAEERQALQMMNEIQELRATMSQQQNQKVLLAVAAYYWLENVYQPVIDRLKPLIEKHHSPTELYCQVLEHKWYLSERAHRDVGHQAAVEDYLKNIAGYNP